MVFRVAAARERSWGMSALGLEMAGAEWGSRNDGEGMNSAAELGVAAAG